MLIPLPLSPLSLSLAVGVGMCVRTYDYLYRLRFYPTCSCFTVQYAITVGKGALEDLVNITNINLYMFRDNASRLVYCVCYRYRLSK